MRTSSELSMRFIEAFNQRNADGMRAMLPSALEYVRPGGDVLRTSDGVMAQYERDWSRFTSSRVDIRTHVESGENVFAEITLHVTVGDRSASVEAAVAHRWRDGRLVRYRAYADPWSAASLGGQGTATQ
jgi:ketosteroid isomerase-like protein